MMSLFIAFLFSGVTSSHAASHKRNRVKHSVRSDIGADALGRQCPDLTNLAD